MAGQEKNPGPQRVRAVRDGFYGGQRIRKGTIFTATGTLGSWMEPVDADETDEIAARLSPKKRKPGEAGYVEPVKPKTRGAVAAPGTSTADI